MKNEQREWWLFGIMAVLIVTVALLAWLDVPPLRAPTLTYQSGTDAATGELSVSVNVGTVEELMQLDDMGEDTAQAIVDYRTKHGFYRSLDELLVVEGIDKEQLDAWRPYFTL